MDRLVISDVKEVEMVYRRGQKFSTAFRLTNLMHTMHVAISLTTPNPAQFSFTNPFSIIPPLSTASYTLFFVPNLSDESPPIDWHHPAFITVRSSMLPTGKAHQDELRRLFSKPGPHVFKDANIPISFIGPDLAEYIICSCSDYLSSVFVPKFSKAISGCSASQLTSLLRLAVEKGKYDFASILMDRGGDINDRDSIGESILSVAVRSGEIDIVKDLIVSGCTIDNSVDKVLHLAAECNRVDLMEVLYSGFKDIDVNSIDMIGRNPIHMAAIHGHVESIKFLLSIGGNPDAVDVNGWTPLHAAASSGHVEAVEFLLNLCSFAKYAVTKKGETPFSLAIEKGHTQLFDSLYLGDALNGAVRTNDTNLIESCLLKGARVNGRDQNGWTPLHRAAFKGNLESAKTLISHGALVDVVDDAGYSPLHCAIETGNVQIALLLIANGAKAHPKSLNGSVPFDLDCLKKQSLASSIVLLEKVTLMEEVLIET